ncbi:MAG TPA: hypothetical protein VGD88_06150 [Opitutaceae bacterium]
MTHQNQARIALRKKMAARDVRVSQLAVSLGHDKAVISKAINHGKYPRVIAKIKEVLSA